MFADLETPLAEAPLFHIDGKDSNPASELERQVQFRAEMRLLMPRVMLAAIPNAGKRGLAAQRQVKREGILAGLPDMIALAPRKIAFIEFKSGRTMPSQAQIDCMNRLTRMGFACGVFRTSESAIAFLRREGFA